jgi:hypothetical protein
MLAVGPCVVGFRPCRSKCCTFLLGCLGGLMTQSGFTLVIQSPPPLTRAYPPAQAWSPCCQGGLWFAKPPQIHREAVCGTFWPSVPSGPSPCIGPGHRTDSHCGCWNYHICWHQTRPLPHACLPDTGLLVTLGCIHHKAGPTRGLSVVALCPSMLLQSWGSGELDLIQPSKLGDPRELNPGSSVVLLICFSR